MVRLADVRPRLRAVPVFRAPRLLPGTDGYFHAPLPPDAQVHRSNQPLAAAREGYPGSFSVISQTTASGLTQVRQP